MPTTDIIPDIHGQAAKLGAALGALGWRRGALGWAHPEPDRQIVFLGDFIDRGTENRAVIRTVRDLIDSGKARAVMGNHELNALHFHARHPTTGQPLRAHSSKNRRQHRAFLQEFALDAPDTREVIAWMQGLPLFIEEPGFRAVHACWTAEGIRQLRAETASGVMSDTQMIRSADPADALFTLVGDVMKGPEHALPKGHVFVDKDGTRRTSVRLKWWRSTAQNWRDVVISVPDLADLPQGPLPADLVSQIYPNDARPVFFGHYWLVGVPILQAPNALCLDYSAGKDGPLVSYTMSSADQPLSLANIRAHAAPG